MKDILKKLATTENNAKWNNCIKRENELYTRQNDMRSTFERDYTRIIHSTAYRRMKHKTQVFFSPSNDHICTRMEHVILVESISYTLANYFGLNKELTKAIAMGHDIGHSPFGHKGEKALSEISKRDFNKTFWHERNGLDIVDSIEVLEDNQNNLQNLNLCYAVRDGIISHCGEIDEIKLKPRDEAIDLKEYEFPNQYAPYTWEGCIVKVADKIAYLGRDIEDAITIGILDEHLEELYELLNLDKNTPINNTVIINNLIYDLCNNSNENGIGFSEETYKLVKSIKRFNYEYIYASDRIKPSDEYAKIVINTIYETLKKIYYEHEKIKRIYPNLYNEFQEWFSYYWNQERKSICNNKKMFDVKNEKDFCNAIVYYISGMTDNYAINKYNEIVGF